jgi:hypothetical protein
MVPGRRGEDMVPGRTRLPDCWFCWFWLGDRVCLVPASLAGSMAAFVAAFE